jgi:hypothetical protein
LVNQIDPNAIYNKLKQKNQNFGSIVDQVDFYKNVPPDQIDRMLNTSIRMPLSSEDMVNNPPEPWGKPDGWDYRTAQTGWKGEALPNGAVGWKPDGTAWYGGNNAYEDWKLSWRNKLAMPAEADSKTYMQMAKEKLTTKTSFGGAIGQIFGAVGDVFNALGSYDAKAGEVPTGLGKLSRWIGQQATGAGLLLGRSAEIAEKQVFARIQGLEDIAKAGNVGGDISPDEKQAEQAVKIGAFVSNLTNPVIGQRVEESLKWLANLADVLLPATVIWNGLRAAVSPISLQEKKDIMAENVRAGEVLYSTFIEPSIKQGYLDRVTKYGEHPYLVAVDMQKPFAEMAGQMLLDPLNVLDFVASGGRAINTITNFQDYIAKPVDWATDFFKGEKGIYRLNKEADLAEVAVKFIEARKDAAQLLESMDVAGNVAGKGLLGKLRPAVNKALEKSGIFSWSASGKRHHLQRVTADMMQTIITVTGKDPQDALEVVKYMAQLHSDDVAEVAEAIGWLGGSKMPLNMVFSEAGQRFSAVFREMLKDSDGIIDAEKFLGKVGELKNVDEYLEFFNKKIDKVAGQMFPDLAKRAEVLGKIEDGTELSKAEKLIGNTPLTVGEKFWLKAEDLADNKLLKKINGFFADVYMGYSPGYAFRNLWTNEFHLLMDMGLGDYVESWVKFNPKIAERELDYLTRSSIGQMAKIGIGQAGDAVSEGKMKFGKRMAGYFEKIGGQRIYGMKYKDTINKIMPKILDETEVMLREAGADDAIVALFRNKAKATWGRMDEAGQAVEAALKNGYIDTFRTMGWMADDSIKFFDDYHLGDNIRAIIRNSEGKPLADVEKEIYDLYKEVKSYIKRTENQVIFSSVDELDGLRGFEALDEQRRWIMDTPFMTDSVKAEQLASKSANQNSDMKFFNALQNDIRIAKQQGINAADVIAKVAEKDPVTAATLDKLWRGEFYDEFHEAWRQTVRTPIQVWMNRLDPLIGKKRKGTVQEVIDLAWRELPFLEGEAPKGMTIQDFKNVIFDVVMPNESRKFYAPLRDNHAAAASYFHTLLEDAGVQFDDIVKGQWQDAVNALEHARAYDTHAIRNLEFDELGQATGSQLRNITMSQQAYDELTSLKALGAANGIPTGVLIPGTNTTISTNTLLTKINDALESMGFDTYEYLDQVPFNMGEMAIQKIKGKDFVGGFRPMVTRIETPAILDDIWQAARLADPTELLAKQDQRLQKFAQAMSLEMAYTLDIVAGRGNKWRMYPKWWRNSGIDFAKSSYKGERGSKAVIAALYDMWEGKDTNAAIFNDLRKVVLNNRIGVQGISDFKLPEAQALMQEMKNLIRAYTPEPSALDDVMDFTLDVPTAGAGAATGLFAPNDVSKYYAREGNRASVLTQAEAKLSLVDQWMRPGEQMTETAINEMLTALKSLDAIDLDLTDKTAVAEFISKNNPTNLRRQLRTRIDEIKSAKQAAKVEANIGQAVASQGGKPSIDDINYALSEVFSDFGIDTSEPYWSPSVVISSPEFFSDPHAYLAAAPRINQEFKSLIGNVRQNYGKMEEVFNNPKLAEKLQEITNFASGQEIMMRNVANEVGTHGRNFALIDYDARRNIDTLTGMLMPYQFWYSRTYPNWAKRLAQNPAILANYSRYKQAMAEVHAGMPDFWKYNINSAELLGLSPDNPIYYNLEQTLNPLQGLLGVDFEDPYKRVDAWSRMLDDLNRFGATTNPIYSYATAFAYLIRGEKEAASRWGSRLVPQTNVLKAALSFLGLNAPELDPFVWLFSGGVDPYERRRVGRALPQMIMEGQLSPEQAIDSAWLQDGEYWNEARQRAIGERAPGTLWSYFFGVGFKGRNQGDIQTDMMYDEFYSLMNRRSNLTPDQFKQEMNAISTKYPFMDSVLISAKTGEARDMAFAYAILDRIPPGDTSRFYDMAGIDRRLVDKFYESRGKFDDWSTSDRQRFMSGIIDMNTMLSIPDKYTAQQWTNAKAAYSQMTEALKTNFGAEINDMIDHYYALKNAGKEGEAKLFLQNNPKVELAMDFKTERIMNDPTGSLQPYYSGLKSISGYYFGQMYDEAEKKWPGVLDLQTEYFTFETSKEKKAFVRLHPELQAYWDYREEQGKLVNQKVINVAGNLPQGLPATMRTDYDPNQVGIGAEDIQAGLNQPEDPLAVITPDEWRNYLGEKGFAAVYQYLESGKSFEYYTKNQLKDVADELQISLDRLVQYVGLSLNQ